MLISQSQYVPRVVSTTRGLKGMCHIKYRQDNCILPLFNILVRSSTTQDPIAHAWTRHTTTNPCQERDVLARAFHPRKAERERRKVEENRKPKPRKAPIINIVRHTTKICTRRGIPLPSLVPRSTLESGNKHRTDVQRILPTSLHSFNSSRTSPHPFRK